MTTPRATALALIDAARDTDKPLDQWVRGVAEAADAARPHADAIRSLIEDGAERREWAKEIVRAVPPVHIKDTDAVPTFKRRPDACIDRAAVLLALEHAALRGGE